MDIINQEPASKKGIYPAKMSTNGTHSRRKVVIITGGASGIGLGITNHFGTQGAHVAILDIHAAAPADLLSTLTSTHPAASFSYHQCDIASWASVAAAFKDVFQSQGHIDTVMANAGISREESLIPATTPTPDTEPTQPGLRTMDVNFTGTLYTVKLAIHYLLLNEKSASTGGSRGSITVTASNAGIYAFPVAPLYGACKAGLVGLIRSLGPPLAPHGIRINGLAPAVLETNIAPSRDLFKGMILTPMSTMAKAVALFEDDVERTGQVAEVHGQSVTVREVPAYVDKDSETNLTNFWNLGYA